MAIATTGSSARTGRTRTGLYFEIRGSGPAVLLIPGATGDAGHFTRSAERLANEFSVITYDRRGNSRSPATVDPETAAGMSAQADDAASLVAESGFDRAVVFGTSGGALIALELLTRHPEVVKGAVIHEPPLLTVLPPHDGPNPLEPVFELARTDMRAAVEQFVRMNASDAAWEATDAATRERLLGNGATLFGYEIHKFLSYQPDAGRLRSIDVPVTLLHSKSGLPFAPPVEQWLQQIFDVQGGVLSGHHAPYLDTPEVFAEELRPLLHQLWS